VQLSAELLALELLPAVPGADGRNQQNAEDDEQIGEEPARVILLCHWFNLKL
jgi:hypothetical protein